MTTTTKEQKREKELIYCFQEFLVAPMPLYSHMSIKQHIIEILHWDHLSPLSIQSQLKAAILHNIQGYSK